MSAEARVQELLDGITPGPWVADQSLDIRQNGVWLDDASGTMIAAHTTEDDAAFIAAAPGLVRALLRVIANVRMVADVIEQTAAESDLPECYLTADQAAGLIRRSLIEES